MTDGTVDDPFDGDCRDCRHRLGRVALLRSILTAFLLEQAGTAHKNREETGTLTETLRL
jgi:hypothetical protein